MTDIEQKALALVREVDNERGNAMMDVFYRSSSCAEALCRAIEQHEAFRQEVSDAVGACRAMWPESWELFHGKLDRFIIAKPDPLVEALEEASGTNDPVEWANRFYAAIEKRGGKITWGEG